MFLVIHSHYAAGVYEQLTVDDNHVNLACQVIPALLLQYHADC